MQVGSSQHVTHPDRTAGDSVDDNALQRRQPLRPRWLFLFLLSLVVSIHAAYFLSGVYWPNPEIVPLATINAELLPEGDSLESGVLAPEGDSLDGSAVPEPEEQAKKEEEPQVEPLTTKKEAVRKAPPPKPKNRKAAERKEKIEKRDERNKAEAKRSEARRAASDGAPREGKPGLRYGLPGGKGNGRGTSRVAGRFGVPGGRGQGSAAAQASCLAAVAGSIRRHTPPHTSLGPGTVFITFYVNSGGGVSGVSASGGSAAHAALARRIVASSRGPSSCGPAYASQSITFQ